MNDSIPPSPTRFIRLLLQKSDTSKICAQSIFNILGQILYVLLPGLLGILIDKVLAQKIWNVSWLLLFPGVWFLSTMLNSVGRFYTSAVTQDMRKITKEIIFKHIIRMPTSVYVNRDAGEVEHLMHELSFDSRYLFSESFPFFMRTVVTVIGSILVAIYSSPELILVFLGWIILFLPLSYFNAKRSIKYVSDSLLSSAEVSASTIEIIENHELIPAFGTEFLENERFEQKLAKEKSVYSKAQYKIDAADLLQRILLITLPVCIALFLVFSGKLIKLTPGSVASIFSFTLILASQIGDFGKGILSTMEIHERMGTALKKLECPPQFRLTTQKERTIRPISWDISFENVGFSFSNTSTTIHNLTMQINEKEKVGIIGYSGAGKTTLIKLLRGIYVPNTGNIFVGGNDLTCVDPKILTQNIAEVSQTIPLFHRTVRENVAYGCPDASDADIWEALKRAQIAQYVENLPAGLDTIVGVKGQRLSGGERARIGIARALIRDSKIIIFDEATAALDSESEFLIQKSLDELAKDRTLIAIAHRFSTLRKMERIVFMDKGQIIAAGTHDELIKNCPQYHKLWNTQMFV